ncbi:InlB B-repeat-containing protein [Neobacillus dielmonensis]|uniref:InlB B-repeat-containing protein n=1 Tax=Neobacillus dielmonensis TaxID=1347369 RepID=UPI0006932976|nr:Ig-like domain-containing protein [Neobacillus dielmonensis]
MFKKRKAKLPRVLAVLLAIMLVVYNLPVGKFALAITTDNPQVVNEQQPAGTEEQNPSTEEPNAGTEEQTNPIPDPEPAPENEPAAHQVTVYSIGEGSGKVSINGTDYHKRPVTVDEGQVDISIEPSQGSEIKSIKIGDAELKTVPNENKDGYTETIANLTEDTTIVIEFGVKTNSITFDSYQNGVITNNEDGKIMLSGEPVNITYGSDFSFTVTPEQGYHVDSMKVDDTFINLKDDINLTKNPDGSYTYRLKNVTAAHTVNVAFAVDTFVLTFQYDRQQGEVKNGSNETIDSAGGTVIVNYGSKPSFKVIPVVGYHIKRITFGDTLITSEVSQSKKEYEFSSPDPVTRDQKVVIEFAINTYNVTAVDPQNGQITIDKPVVDYNGNATVTITPDYDYHLEQLLVDGTKVTDGITANDAEGSYTYVIPEITADKTVEANFVKDEPLEGNWEDYVSITGSLAKDAYHEGNKEIRIYSRDSAVSITPKEGSAYDLISLRSFRGWKTEYTLKQSAAIEKMKVKSSGSWGSKQVPLPDNIYIVFDTKSPVLSSVKLDGPNKDMVDGSQWFSGPVQVSGTIDNGKEDFYDISYSSDIDKVFYSKVGEETVTEASYDSKSNQFKFTADTSGSYKVWAVDKAGNQSSKVPVMVNIDKNAPTLADGRSVKVEQINDDKLSEFLNHLTLGMFFNKAIQVTVNAKDEASGVQKISLQAISKNSTDKKIEPKLVDEYFSRDAKTAQAVFVIDEESFEGTFSVDVTDRVTNHKTYDVTKDNIEPAGNPLFMIDRKKPTVEMKVKPEKQENPYVKVNESTGVVTEYYSDDVKLDINAADDASGVNTVKIDLNGKNYKTYPFSKEAKELKPAIEAINTNDLTEEGRLYDFTVDVKDNAGNSLEEKARKTIYIDENAPTLDEADGDAVHLEVENDSTIAKLLNYLSFGTFFNKQIKITVKVNDDAAGIKDLSLKAVPDGETEAPSLVQTNLKNNGLTAEAEYTMDAEYFKGTFSVEVTDNVNNKSAEPYMVTSSNSNIASETSGVVMIEKTKPEAAIHITPKTGITRYVDGDQKEFYSGEVNYDVNAEDTDSGVNTVHINVNDQLIDEYYFDNEKAAQLKPDLTARDTEKTNRKEDGSYQIYTEIVDNAGNANQAEKTIYIDETSPEITDFEFSGVNATDSLKHTVEQTDYGFYFKNPVQVTVKAEDPEKDNDFEATSKLKTMVVYLQDYENGKYYAVLANGTLQEVDPSQLGSMEAIPTEGIVTFTVPASFKGQIFAKATDHVNNSSDFVTPDGTVIEDEKQHAKEKHIEFEKAETTYTDNNNLDLYNQNVDVKLTVADTYSGISDIQWSVVAPYDTANNQTGHIIINNDKTYAPGSTAEGWEQTKNDQNLVTEMTKTLHVTNNSNEIKVKVKVTDRAGNTSEEEMTFSIDKTAPTIEVTYDNNSADSENHDYYKADRTATIVVTERNFRPQDVEHLITNTDGAIPNLSGWSTKVNAADPDQTIHTATIRYTADGDYTFDIKYKDNANNGAAPFAQQKFTLDKTVPVINVSYSNNAAANGNYYKAARTATITINEHNFDTSRIKVTGSASDGGAQAAFPGVSGWTTRGDVHTATINYSADGKYSFDIDYTDMAGNVAADYKADEFFVDQTAPELTITGVEDQSANNGDVAPVISYADTNFNKNSVSISLTGANRGTVKLDGSLADTPNGQVYAFKNFDKTKENDDLYTLTATLVDFAGNTSTQTIRFSVNRFGSVYVFDEALKKIEGKYVKNETDVIVTETNVDSLNQDSINVKMTKNGTPADLKKGPDYSVSETGGSGKWSQYTYVVKKDLFAGDGRYTVALYSEDAAGNINENIDETKKAEISFGIDKTAPVIVPVDLENGAQYPVETKPVTFTVKDNLVLNETEIYLNGKKVDHKADGENYTIEVPSANTKQEVKIVAVDAAGNELEKRVDDFLVSTNLFVRWYNNTPLFAGSIGGVGGLAIATAAVIMYRKQKRKDEADVVEG